MAIKKVFQQVAGKVVEKETKTSYHPLDDLGGKIFKENEGDPFFSPINIERKKANRIFPYRLLVIDIRTGQLISTGDISDFYIEQNTDTGGYLFAQENYSQWEFVLPITPQQLSVTDQFAINTTATMRGVVEEHNGVKFKIISASGTTGIWPNRMNFEDKDSGIGKSLFGGTIESFNNLRTQLDKFASKEKPQSSNKEAETTYGTGYAQALILQQFLEQYAIAKKDPEKKHWRLVFDCPKTSESFIVTPLQYTVTRSQRSPNEFLYNMQFKAWKRVDLKRSFYAKQKEIQLLTPNLFQTISNSLDNARSIMSASLNVIKAVRADFRKPFDELRKVTLLVKDFAGLVTTLADLPNQINRDITSATKQRSTDLKLSNAGSLPGVVGPSPKSRVAQAKITNTLNLIKNESDKNEGLSADAIESGENGTEARNSQKSSPINDVFDNPEGNFDFFASIGADELPLTPKQRQKIQDEIELNSLISIEEIKDIVRNTQDLILDLSNNFGAGDSFFSKVYNRPEPRKRATPMTIEEFELINALENAVLNMNLLVATRQFDDVRSQTSLEYVGGLAQDSEIPFNSSYTSKYLAPVPFGLTIQEIAARYMGDADLYNEIVTLNNLRSPYIDEDGFFYSLLSNGDGRQFNIGSNKNLFVGQKIQLSSNTVPMFTRKITAIERITDTNYLITVDGLSDLDQLKTIDNAKLKAFLPGTVNSQNQIYIPSNDIVDAEPRTFDIPFLKEDTLTGLSKVDWLLDDSGDLVINSFGEASLANGLNNLVQALKMKVTTSKGAILSDPNYGLGLKPGVVTADLSAQSILEDLKGTILADDRFEAVDKIEINILPPEVSITIQTRLANGRGIFPINFTV